MFNFTSCDISFLVLLIYLHYKTLVFNFTSFDITYLDTYTFVFNLTSFDRVPAQVLQSLISVFLFVRPYNVLFAGIFDHKCLIKTFLY